jgi:hypothetical protein
MAFVRADKLPTFHALMNSSVFAFLVRVQSDAVRIQFQGGLVEGVPIPTLPSAAEERLAALARQAWSLKRSLDTRIETSNAFTLPALLQVDGDAPLVRAGAWANRSAEVEREVANVQREIDELCFDLYGIEEADRSAIAKLMGVGFDSHQESDDDPEGESTEIKTRQDEADAVNLASETVSWAVGVAFGRFDIRLATDERQQHFEAGPFDKLPICSPGVLICDRAAGRAPSGYPLTFPENGVLVDDPGHAQDVTAAVHGIFDIVFGTRADRFWNDVAAILNPKGHDVRFWLVSDFFEHHLKRYSKSRRKAPIIWQLAVPSGRYSLWLYAHRMNSDTFFQIQNDVVAPKLAHEERQLTSLMQSAGGNPSSRERKEIAAQEALVDELRTLFEEVKRVAPLWNPTLEDGVVLTMAPLWRLVPQHKPWQKELKSKWDELAAGKYDWSHVSMHLWPERVVPKCMTDRSLAIAHGLEGVFWVEGTDGKWKARSTPNRTAAELILERSSPAVKSALNSLLESPTRAPASRRRRTGAETEGVAMS